MKPVVSKGQPGVWEPLAGGGELVEWWGVKTSFLIGVRTVSRAVLLTVVSVGMVSCVTSDSKKRERPPLPGSGDIDSKAWGRAFPGDVQRGQGMMPTSR